MEIFMSPQNFWKSLECKYASKPCVFGVWKAGHQAHFFTKCPTPCFSFSENLGARKNKLNSFFCCLATYVVEVRIPATVHCISPYTVCL